MGFIEAIAAGLPIIATAISAIPEMVRYEETGLLIQPGDRPALAQSLCTLMNNPQLRSTMGLRARQLATQNSMPTRTSRSLNLCFGRLPIEIL
ncbi:glycosyltransferase [Leptodesmis sp.]|uniref:glycosyltransferase n=1 Tax=Leptodesmis sp. TaxID=3100501 RepID=UPI0040534710